MAFKKGGFNLPIFILLIIFIFFKNILQDYWYQAWNVAEWETFNAGLFSAVFENIEWLLFWVYFRNVFVQKWKLVLMFFLTAIFTTIPDFLSKPIFALDNDNLLVKGVLYFIPFAIFLVLKRSYGQFFLPFMMGFIPLVNLEIANGFSGNVPFLQFLFEGDYYHLELNSQIFIDLRLPFIKSIFWAVTSIMFYEISHQFFAIKSWRLQVELPLSKGYLLVIFIVFKTLIYWLVGSLIIALLGNSSLPLFSNKVGLILNTIGFMGYLILSILYFRKYMTMYFYDKCGHSNWLYPFLFLPIVDIFSLLILLVFPARHIKRFFAVRYSKELLVSIVAGLLLIYATLSYFMDIKNISSSEQGLVRALWVAKVFLPIVSALGIYLSLQSKWCFRLLMMFFFAMYPVFFFYIVPNLELGLKIGELVNVVGFSILIGVSLSFLYPVVNFKSFLKIN